MFYFLQLRNPLLKKQFCHKVKAFSRACSEMRGPRQTKHMGPCICFMLIYSLTKKVVGIKEVTGGHGFSNDLGFYTDLMNRMVAEPNKKKRTTQWVSRCRICVVFHSRSFDKSAV